jgi:hypothetical protein
MYVTTYRQKSRDNLRSLYILLQLYAQNYGCYPTLQPEATRYALSGGVRDLYPLWTSGIMRSEQLDLLQQSGAKLIPFPDDITVDDFDKLHIGYAYNSTAIWDSPDVVPLVSDQGVSDGVLHTETNDPGIRAVSDEGALVLFTSGKTEWIPANRRGRLDTSLVSSQQWALLRD